MKTKTIEINEISVDELADKVADKLLIKIKDFIQIESKKTDLLLTRKEVSAYFKISVVTVHEWTKKRRLHPYKVGNRVFYKKQEILELINQSNPK